MGAIEIVGAKASYIDSAREICKATAHSSFRARFDVLYLMYLDYYMLCQPENCFMVKDGDNFVGYILSAETTRFIREYKSLYLKRLYGKSLYRIGEMELEFARARKLIKKGYTYHLHIDIIDGYQHHGLGTKLMDTLLERLRALGVPGVYLEVYSDNEKAIGFYKKYGFTVQRKHIKYLVMGLKLDNRG